MSSDITQTQRETPTPTTPTHGARLRTVTGNRWPRTCACGCGQPIPRAADVRYVVDFGAPKPYPAYLREHSPDFGSYRGGRGARATEDSRPLPGFTPASQLPRGSSPSTGSSAPDPAKDSEKASGLSTGSHPSAVAHHLDSPDATPSPEAGRAWASGQLVFNAGQFESARSGFADYAREGETATRLRARVNQVILEDLEAKVIALKELHEKLRDRLQGPSFADLVSQRRPV
jgi:hypothetical protein